MNRPVRNTAFARRWAIGHKPAPLRQQEDCLHHMALGHMALGHMAPGQLALRSLAAVKISSGRRHGVQSKLSNPNLQLSERLARRRVELPALDNLPGMRAGLGTPTVGRDF